MLCTVMVDGYWCLHFVVVAYLRDRAAVLYQRWGVNGGAHIVCVTASPVAYPLLAVP